MRSAAHPKSCTRAAWPQRESHLVWVPSWWWISHTSSCKCTSTLFNTVEEALSSFRMYTISGGFAIYKKKGGQALSIWSPGVRAIVLPGPTSQYSLGMPEDKGNSWHTLQHSEPSLLLKKAHQKANESEWCYDNKIKIHLVTVANPQTQRCPWLWPSTIEGWPIGSRWALPAHSWA